MKKVDCNSFTECVDKMKACNMLGLVYKIEKRKDAGGYFYWIFNIQEEDDSNE